MESIKNLRRWWNRPKSTFMEYVQAFVVIIPLAFLIRTFFYGLYEVPTGSMETTLLRGERFVSDKFTFAFIRKPMRGEIIAFNSPLFEYSDNALINWWQHYVWGPENWTKRVIGLPGEHIEGKVEEGHPVIYVNGERLDEPYVNRFPLVPVTLEWSPRSYDPDFSFSDQPFYRMDEAQVRRVQRIFRDNGIETERIAGTPLTHGGSDVFDVHLKSKAKDGIDEYWVMGDNRLGSGDSRMFGTLNGNFIHGRILFRIFSFDAQSDWLIIDLLKHPIEFFTRFRWSRCMQFVS